MSCIWLEDMLGCGKIPKNKIQLEKRGEKSIKIPSKMNYASLGDYNVWEPPFVKISFTQQI